MPIRVKRESKRNIGIPYNSGFDIHPSKDNQLVQLPEGSIIEIKIPSKDTSTSTVQSFVLTQPVYVNPVKPPNPK